MPGNPPYAPCPLWHGATHAFSFCMLAAQQSLDRLRRRCAVGRTPFNWSRRKFGSPALKGRYKTNKWYHR